MEELIAAIIALAVKDYAIAFQRYVRFPNRQEYIRECEELEAFFRSRWFETLSNMDGEVIIKKTREYVKKREAKV